MKQQLLNQFRLRATLLAALLCAAFTGAWADEETFTFANLGYANGEVVEAVEGDGVTITFDKGTNSNNAPKYYNTGSAVRTYGGNSFTVACNDAEALIQKIELTFASGEGSNAISTDADAYADGVWEGSAGAVTFTIGGTSGHRRIAAITVTYGAGGEAPEKEDPVIVVQDETVAYGSTLTVDDSVIEGGRITVTSGNTAVATVNGLVITPQAVGTTTITVSTAASTQYNAGQETFTLTVTAPQASADVPANADNVITLDFTSNAWNLPEGSANKATDALDYTNGTYTITVAAPTSYYYNTTDNYLILGRQGATVTLPAFAGAVKKIEVDGRAGASAAVLQNIYVTEGDEEVAVSTETKGAQGTNVYEIDEDYQAAGTVYTLKVNSNHNTQITAIRVYVEGTPVANVRLNAAGFATLCYQYPLSFAGLEDVTAWQVTDVEGDVITFDQVQQCAGGQGLVLVGEPAAEVAIPAVANTEVLGSNLLEGTLAPTYVEAGAYYGLSGENFVPVAEGTVKAGKALLDAGWVSSEVKSLTLVFNGTTGVREVRTVSAAEAAALFNLAGQRVSKAQQGIFIQNGKKVIVK